MPDVFSCEVVINEKLAEGVFGVTVLNRRLVDEARAGQFLHIKCGGERLLRRPISICGVRGDALEFVFEVKGEGTRWLSKRVPGDKLDVLGPLGRGFRMPEGRVLVVGGGIGAPPVLFAADSAKSGVTALLGFRDKGRMLLKGEFEKVCDEVYVTTDDGSFGMHGPVTAKLKELLECGVYDSVLACGPFAMLSAVNVLCMEYGAPCQVSLEERMGCGVGACLVCACATMKDGIERMSHVCIDGPVFDAAEVVW
jgi:dihydroorotate dehydrogenase electron transfer subunit